MHACDVQYIAMEPDVQTLQPTSHPIVSYRSYGQTESAVIPEFRLQTTSTDADLWSPQHGLLRLMEGACMGLMENSTALDLIKVGPACADTSTAPVSDLHACASACR